MFSLKVTKILNEGLCLNGILSALKLGWSTVSLGWRRMVEQLMLVSQAYMNGKEQDWYTYQQSTNKSDEEAIEQRPRPI